MSIAPDWYLDPTNRHEQRYWDGSRWTEHVRDGSSTTTDPVDVAPQVRLEPLDPVEPGAEPGDARVEAVTAPQAARVEETDEGAGAVADEPRSRVGTLVTGHDAFARSAGLTAADARPRHAHAMARGAQVVALLALFLSLTVILGVVGVVGGLLALVVGLGARQRLVELGDTDQTPAVRAALLGVLAAMVGTLATVLLVALWTDGELVRFVVCTEQGGVGDCLGDLVREARHRLAP